VVAEGKLDQAGVFHADQVLAKHDENYMPPEAADALKKAREGVLPPPAATPGNVAAR
jgi:cytochrome c-type biogenesis protein CcmE